MILSALIVLLGGSLEFPREAENRLLFQRMYEYCQEGGLGGPQFDFNPSFFKVRAESKDKYYVIDHRIATMHADLITGRPRWFRFEQEQFGGDPLSDEHLLTRATTAAEIFTGLDLRLRSVRPGYQERSYTYQEMHGTAKYEGDVSVRVQPGTGKVLFVASTRFELPRPPAAKEPKLTAETAQAAGAAAVMEAFGVAGIELRGGADLYVSDLRGLALSNSAFRSESTLSERTASSKGQGFLVYKTRFARPGSRDQEYSATVNALDGRALVMVDFKRAAATFESPAPPAEVSPIIIPATFDRISSRTKIVSSFGALKRAKVPNFANDFPVAFWADKTAYLGHVDRRGFAKVGENVYVLPQAILRELAILKPPTKLTVRT